MRTFTRLIFFCPAAARAARRLLKAAPVQLVLLFMAVFGGTRALAQEFDTVYELRTNGSILQTTCSGNSCQGSLQLDDNPAAASITSGGGGLFQMHSNASIWEYAGPPCGVSGCPGWLKMDDNSGTAAIAAGYGLGGSPYLFQLHFSGSIWQSTGTPCGSGGCPGWIEVDNNSLTKQIIAAGGTMFFCSQTSCPPSIPPLVQLHSDGTIWQYTGTPCSSTGCPGWQKLDDNPSAVQIFGFVSGGGGPDSIFEFHNDGSIWKYVGPPCSGNSCPGWQFIGSAPSAKAIMTAETSGRLFAILPAAILMDQPSARGVLESRWPKAQVKPLPQRRQLEPADRAEWPDRR